MNGVPDVAAVVLLSDELGNLTYDGRWHFEYDVLGRMIGAYRPSAADPQVRGTLFARFGYNAMGQRVTAAYDVDGAPDSLGYPTGDGDLSNNPREVFAYDDKWQLVAVFNQGPVESGSGGARNSGAAAAGAEGAVCLSRRGHAGIESEPGARPGGEA